MTEGGGEVAQSDQLGTQVYDVTFSISISSASKPITGSNTWDAIAMIGVIILLLAWDYIPWKKVRSFLKYFLWYSIFLSCIIFGVYLFFSRDPYLQAMSGFLLSIAYMMWPTNLHD